MIDNIDLSKSIQYKLSIRLSSDGFSFSIVDPNSPGDYYYSSYEVSMSYSMSMNLKQWFTTCDVFNRKYKEVDVIIDSSRFTIIPIDLFEENSADKIFYYNFNKINNEEIIVNRSLKNNMIVLFGFDKHAVQLLKEYFKEVNIISSITAIADYYAQKCSASINRRLYVDVEEHNMKVFCFEKNKISLINIFDCKQTSDRIYYLLYVWKSLDYDKEKDYLILNGKIKNKEELLKTLRSFIPQVYNFLPKAEFNRSPIAQIEALPFDMQTLLYESN